MLSHSLAEYVPSSFLRLLSLREAILQVLKFHVLGLHNRLEYRYIL